MCMPGDDKTEEEARQAVLDKGQLVIERLRELQRASDHLKAGGSSDEEWVRIAMSRDEFD